MNSEFKDILRRIKPDKRREESRPGPKSQRHFIGPSWQKHTRLLYDTTVYIDILQERFPRNAELILRAAEAWPSTVTGAELASLCGQLDPGHSGTRAVVEQVTAIIDRRPAHRTITPDRKIWLDAGVLAGTLGRLQQY